MTIQQPTTSNQQPASSNRHPKENLKNDILRKLITIFIVIGLLPIPLFAQTRQGIVKVTTLIENRKINDAEGLVAEHGLSLFIQREGQTILFDTGSSNNVIHNAIKLGVDLRSVDIVIISHAHFDHAGGLPYFLKANEKAIVYISKNAQNNLEFRDFLLKMGEEYPDRIQFIDESAQIAKDTYIISGIKRNELSLDYVDHEITLVLKNGNGLIVFTGCGHSGILNIIGTVRKIFPQFFIKAVFGGFHLDGLSFEAENATKTKLFVEMIGKQMLASPILRIYTGHCTGTKPYEILKGVLGDKLQYLATGSKIYVF